MPQPIVSNPVLIFFIVLVIILMAPLLLNRLRIPHIIGMIVAGVLIGPYGLNILAYDSSFSIFGQVGILYLMFLAGLEIDMYHLKLNLRRGAVFGFLTLTIPLALGLVTSRYILNLNWVTSLLLGSMYASHTLISYPVVARLGITRAPAVLMAIVGTIIAVVGALLTLAGAVDVAKAGVFDILHMGWLLLTLSIYCGLIIFFYPRITRYFFKNYSDKVTQYVFVLALVFLSAWSAQYIGLEPVLGAFFAGLVLNRYIPSASPLMSSIEFVGNALFIPYFLISVGMMINVRLLADADTLLVALLMLTVAIVSKWLPAFITQKINHMDRASGNVLFGLTCAHTAVALAVLTVGFSMHLFNEQMLNATVLVILVTCAVAPIITSSAASKVKIQMVNDLDQDDAPAKREKRGATTLIAVANPLTIQGLVELGVLMRNERGSHHIIAAHVRNENSGSARAMSDNALNLAKKTASLADVPLSTLDRYDLNTVTGLLNVMTERDVTDIIMGMHRSQGFLDTFFGKKVEELLKNSHKMVILSRCYIPLNTIRGMIIYVPDKAQYETGFRRWVKAVANLTRQLGCKAKFYGKSEVLPLIKGILYKGNYTIRMEFHECCSWDDFIIASAQMLDDDLFVMVAARPHSVSHTSDMNELPNILQYNFSRNNIIVIYPEQFGQEPTYTSFADPLMTDTAYLPSPLWLAVRRRIYKLYIFLLKPFRQINQNEQNEQNEQNNRNERQSEK